MATRGFRPGVGNIATYTEGKLKEKINKYSSTTVDLSNITSKLSSSYAGSNNFEGDLLVEGALKTSGSFAAVGNISGSGKGYFEKDVEIADSLSVTGSITSKGNVVIGADADGTDRTITFGHSTLKTTIGIDDSGDVFAINTDNAFEAANDLQIDTSGHVTLGNGNLVIGADADGTDRTITFGHTSLKTTIGIDDSSDVFAINTDNAFETGNDFEIDTAGNTTISHGRLQVLGTEGLMTTRISGSGKGYFEKDVAMADNLYVSGSANISKAVYALKFSGSSANTSTLLGD